MADSPAKVLFESLSDYPRLQGLIDAGEAEGQHLECKAPQGPEFGRDQRVGLARAVSGFANSGGGVVLWGMATVKHQGGLDVLTQTTPIGNIARFRQHVERAVGRAVEPAMPNVEHRTLRERATDAAGVLVTHIPPTPGDPVQTADDHVFYIRAGDEFVPMPYDVLRRMFAGTEGPLIEPTFDSRLVKAIEDEWEIPLVVANLSSALGREVRVSVVVENPEACERVRSTGLNDLSTVNPGKTMFGSRLDQPVYRGLNVVIGTLFVTMKKEKRRKRRLDLRISIFADKMRARSWLMRVQLAQSGFAVNAVTSDFLY